MTIAEALAEFLDCRDGRYYHETHGLVSEAERNALVEDMLDEADTTPRFTVGDDADAFVEMLRKEVNAPWINVGISTLGGADRASIMVKLSLDPKDSWVNGILHNSRYAMFSLDRDGVIEQFSAGGRDLKFRKGRYKSPKDAVAKLNAWIKKVGTKDESVLDEVVALDRKLVRNEAEGLGINARDVNLAVEAATQRTMTEWPFPSDRSAIAFAESAITGSEPVIKQSSKLLAALASYVVGRVAKARQRSSYSLTGEAVEAIEAVIAEHSTGLIDLRRLDEEGEEVVELVRIHARPKQPDAPGMAAVPYNGGGYASYCILSNGLVIKEFYEDGKNKRVYMGDVGTKGIVSKVAAIQAAATKLAGSDVNTEIVVMGESALDEGEDVLSSLSGADRKAMIQAYRDWMSNTAYIDNAGNYHLRERGTPTHRGAHKGVAPWNKLVKKHYGRTTEQFHADAKAYAASVRGAKGYAESDDQLDEFDPITAIGALGSIAVGGAVGIGAVKAIRTIKELLRLGKKTAAEHAWDKLSAKDAAEVKRILAQGKRKLHASADPTDTVSAGLDEAGVGRVGMVQMHVTNLLQRGTFNDSARVRELVKLSKLDQSSAEAVLAAARKHLAATSKTGAKELGRDIARIVGECVDETILPMPHAELLSSEAYRFDPGKRQPKVLKNLGWLLRNWQDITSFTVEKYEGNASMIDAVLIAHTKGGGMYATTYASKSVLKQWLNRPVFKGLPVYWFGSHQTVGESEGWEDDFTYSPVDEAERTTFGELAIGDRWGRPGDTAVLQKVSAAAAQLVKLTTGQPGGARRKVSASTEVVRLPKDATRNNESVAEGYYGRGSGRGGAAKKQRWMAAFHEELERLGSKSASNSSKWIADATTMFNQGKDPKEAAASFAKTDESFTSAGVPSMAPRGYVMTDDEIDAILDEDDDLDEALTVVKLGDSYAPANKTGGKTEYVFSVAKAQALGKLMSGKRESIPATRYDAAQRIAWTTEEKYAQTFKERRRAEAVIDRIAESIDEDTNAHGVYYDERTLRAMYEEEDEAAVGTFEEWRAANFNLDEAEGDEPAAPGEPKTKRGMKPTATPIPDGYLFQSAVIVDGRKVIILRKKGSGMTGGIALMIDGQIRANNLASRGAALKKAKDIVEVAEDYDDADIEFDLGLDEELDEVSPPGFKGTVKAMKRKHPEIDNPYALAWWMKKRGAKSNYKADGTKKDEGIDEGLTPKTMKVGRFYAVRTSSSSTEPDYYLFVTGFQKNGTAKGVAYDVSRNKSAKDSFNGYNLSLAREVSQADIDGGAKANIARKLGGQSFEDFTEDCPVDFEDDTVDECVELIEAGVTGWRTTDSGHRIYIEGGKVTKGNPHLMKAVGAKKGGDEKPNRFQPSPEAKAKADKARELHGERKKVKGKLNRLKRLARKAADKAMGVESEDFDDGDELDEMAKLSARGRNELLRLSKEGAGDGDLTSWERVTDAYMDDGTALRKRDVIFKDDQRKHAGTWKVRGKLKVKPKADPAGARTALEGIRDRAVSKGWKVERDSLASLREGVDEGLPPNVESYLRAALKRVPKDSSAYRTARAALASGDTSKAAACIKAHFASPSTGGSAEDRAFARKGVAVMNSLSESYEDEPDQLDEADVQAALRKVLIQNPGQAFNVKQLAMAVTSDEMTARKAINALVIQGTAQFKRGEGYSLAGNPGALRMTAADKQRGKMRVTGQRTYDYSARDAEKRRRRMGEDEEDDDEELFDETTRSGGVGGRKRAILGAKHFAQGDGGGNGPVNYEFGLEDAPEYKGREGGIRDDAAGRKGKKSTWAVGEDEELFGDDDLDEATERTSKLVPGLTWSVMPWGPTANKGVAVTVGIEGGPNLYSSLSALRGVRLGRPLTGKAATAIKSQVKAAVKGVDWTRSAEELRDDPKAKAAYEKVRDLFHDALVNAREDFGEAALDELDDSRASIQINMEWDGEFERYNVQLPQNLGPEGSYPKDEYHFDTYDEAMVFVREMQDEHNFYTVVWNLSPADQIRFSVPGPKRVGESRSSSDDQTIEVAWDGGRKKYVVYDQAYQESTYDDIESAVSAALAMAVRGRYMLVVQNVKPGDKVPTPALAEGALDEGGKPVGKAQLGIMDALHGQPSRSLTSIAASPGLRGVNFGKIQKAAEALAKKGLVKLRDVDGEGTVVTPMQAESEEQPDEEVTFQFEESELDRFVLAGQTVGVDSAAPIHYEEGVFEIALPSSTAIRVKELMTV